MKYAPYDGNALGRLARAYALSGDTAKAKTAYQDFLTLWKDADPDIPIPERSQSGVCEAEVSPYIDLPDRTP